MKRAIVKALIVMGFVFATVSFLTLPILFVITPISYRLSLLFSTQFIYFHPLPYALLGIFMAALMRFEKSDYVKEWSDRVIIANIIALTASIIIPFIIFLVFKIF